MLLLVPALGLATDHSGTIALSETWLAADNPHVVVDHVTVDASATLTLEPGVEVYFNSGRRLSVNGALSAVGAAGQEILFTQNTASLWGYIYFPGTGSGTFSHCTLEYSTYSIYAAGSGAISMSDFTVRDCSYGLYLVGSNPVTLSGGQVQDNTYGVYVTGGSVDLASTTISGNTNSGFRGLGVAPGLLDANVVFMGNATGLYVSGVAALTLTTPFSATDNTTTGVHLIDCEGPFVDNLTLTGNAGTTGPLFLDDCGEFTLGAGNSIGGVGLENSWPLSIGAGSYPSAVSVIPTTGNTNDDIQVYGGSSPRTGTWRKFTDLDYVVAAHVTVEMGGGLTIEPAVNVRLNASRRLNIYGDLTAVGAPGQRILFTPNTASVWGYLYFAGAGIGTFDYCTLEEASYAIYGGGAGAISVSNTTLQDCSYGIYSTSTNAYSLSDCQVQDNSYGAYMTGGSLDLANTSFVGNGSYGLHTSGVAPTLLDANIAFLNNGTGVHVRDVPGLNLTSAMNVTGSTVTGIHLLRCDNAVVDNQVLLSNIGAQGAIYVVDSGEFTLGASNVIGGVGLENSWPLTIGIGSYPSAASSIPSTGNTNDDILAVTTSSDRTGTWRAFPGLDYVISGHQTVQAGGELIIEPDVNLRFNASRQLTVYGTLTVIGAPGQEILFTQNSVSNWNGLNFATDGAGTLEHCIIEEATYGIYANSTGNIATTGVTIQGCSYGVNASHGTITFLNDRIINNDNYGIYLVDATLTFGQDLTEWNDIYGSGTGQPGRDLYLHNHPDDVEARWVHWGTMDHEMILGQIRDFHDAWGLGYVHILPYVNAAHDAQTTAVDDAVPGNVPLAFALRQNTPNPFNPSTLISFDLPARTAVRLEIYDVSGARVAVLVDEELPAGPHEAAWRGTDDRGRALPSGAYFYRIAAGRDVETRQMMLIK